MPTLEEILLREAVLQPGPIRVREMEKTFDALRRLIEEISENLGRHNTEAWRQTLRSKYNW